MKSNKVNEKVMTANELTNVKDIKKNIIYRKTDNYIIGLIRLYPINIDLLSENEVRSICNTLTASFKSEDKPFSILSIPRTVDMEEYLTYLSNLYDDEIESPNRKMLLNVMIKEASEKVMNGNNFEHQYYLKVWEKNSSTDGKESKIAERLNNFIGRYGMIQNYAKRTDDTEIIKLCNLYANSNTAIFEDYDNADYVPLPFMKGKKNE